MVDWGVSYSRVLWFGICGADFRFRRLIKVMHICYQWDPSVIYVVVKHMHIFKSIFRYKHYTLSGINISCCWWNISQHLKWITISIILKYDILIIVLIKSMEGLLVKMALNSPCCILMPVACKLWIYSRTIGRAVNESQNKFKLNICFSQIKVHSKINNDVSMRNSEFRKLGSLVLIQK